MSLNTTLQLSDIIIGYEKQRRASWHLQLQFPVDCGAKKNSASNEISRCGTLQDVGIIQISLYVKVALILKLIFLNP